MLGLIDLAGLAEGDGALGQVRNVLNHPRVMPPVALMPDAHQGYGVPIGGVVAFDKAVCPNAVGVDIGCGANYTPLSVEKKITKEQLSEIMERFYKDIPVGHKIHEQPLERLPIPINVEKIINASRKSEHYIQKGLGTLGGGNHFLELNYCEADNTYGILIHTGSRYIGKLICEHYHKKAVALCTMWDSPIPNKELAHIPLQSELFLDYMTAMQYAVDYAKRNRELIRNMALGIIVDILQDNILGACPAIDTPHNYASLEQYNGKDLFIHRKGAVLARKDMKAIVLGSMGTPSYIVKGKGCESVWNSCSHGAGRDRSRTASNKLLDINECEASLVDVVHRPLVDGQLDETPQAYKDIDEVMAKQSDSVAVIKALIPLMSVKG